MSEFQNYKEKVDQLRWLVRPFSANNQQGLDRRSEMVATLALLTAIFSTIALLLFPLADDAGWVGNVRIAGIVGSIAAYVLARMQRTDAGVWLLIMLAIHVPAFSAAASDAALEASSYLHLGTVLAFFALPNKQATMAGIVSLMLVFVLAIVSSSKPELIYANIIMGFSLIAMLRVAVQHREKQLRQIESQAARLVAYEQGRQELVRHQEQADFLKQVVSNLGHDIKTPLSVINLQSNILEHKHGDPMITRRTRKIIEAVEQIDAVIENLRQLNRASESAILPAAQVDLNQLIREASEGWLDANGQYEMHLSKETLMLQGNRDSLRLAVQALIENAFVHGESDVMVSVTTGSRDGDIVFSVTDTGPGIAREELASIFEFTYKIDKSRQSSQGGTGLGLPIAKRIIENHGGRIEVDSDLGMGTQVNVCLPAIEFAAVPV